MADARLYFQLAGVDCIRIDSVLDDRQQTWESLGPWQRANSVTLRRGRRASDAWLLISKSDRDALDVNTSKTITVVHESGTKSLPGWYIRSVEAVDDPGDSTQTFCVHLQDVRCIGELKTISAQSAVIKGTHRDTSGGPGTTVTWQQVIDDLWSELPGAGSAPTLAYSPASKAENLTFDGLTAWQAICQAAHACGNELIPNPTAGTFSFVQYDGTQTGLSAAISAANPLLLWDGDLSSANAGNYPESVGVIFPPKTADSNKIIWYGDSSSNSVSTGITGAVSGTRLDIIDTTRYEDGSNAAQIAARLTDLTKTIKGISRACSSKRVTVYHGFKDFAPGEELTEVTWADGHGSPTTTLRYFEDLKFETPSAYPRLPVKSGSGGSGTLLVRFTLGADLAYTAGATATATVTDTSDGSATGGTITVKANWAIRAKSGAIGTAVLDNSGQYWIIDIALPQIVTGTLASGPSSAHQASISVTIDDEFNHAFSSDPLTVYNPNGILYGACLGSFCTAKFNPVSNHYELISVQKFATRIRGYFDDAATCSPAIITTLVGVDAPLPPTMGSTTSFVNPTGWYIQGGMKCEIELNHSTGQWEVCGTQTIASVVDVYLDGLTLKQRFPNGAFPVDNGCTSSELIYTGTEC